jgi:hypothetical protein
MATQSTDLDATAIHRAVSDHSGGWDEGNAQRIGISLHERLAKRAVRRDHRGKEILDELTKTALLEKTRAEGGSDVPPDKRHCTITILDRQRRLRA